jgi:methylated-DNA-[protein]-cysteine S-methyltransferase
MNVASETGMTIYATMPSPVGELLLTAVDAGLTRVYFERHLHGDRIAPEWRAASASADPAAEILAEARRQLDAYFAGHLTAFTVPLAPSGTPFQQRVWMALRALPFGDTVSYGEIARRIGAPDAVRAVGAANGRNPLSIIVPCHRVIGSDGSLTGFGGGVDRKRWLLQHEGVLLI